MLKTAKLTKDMEPGVYMLTKRARAWKGFRRGDLPYTTMIEIPRGAIVVVPRHRDGQKVRTDKFFLPGRGGLTSPIQGFPYIRGKHYESGLNKNIELSCERGLHFSLTREGARYWAHF